MSLADQVTNLTNDRNNIRTSLVNKGITEADSHGFSSFDDDIDRMVKPEGTITVTENGTYDVTEREGIVVDVYTVEPIDSPEADIGDLKSGGTLRVVWNNVQDAICYTVERKHGDNGSWQVVKTLSVSKGLINEYLDADVIPGDYYYYRVYAISDGSVYGNSLSSNIASAMAPYGGGRTNLFIANDFCEDVTGGWIVEPYPCDPASYPPMPIDPYVPVLDSDGNIIVTRGGSSNNKAIWVHTVNKINLQNNGTDIFERLVVRHKLSLSRDGFMFGVFKEASDGFWDIYTTTNSSTSFGTNTFIFENNPATPSVPSKVPAGEYYVGFVLHTYPSVTLTISDCYKMRRTWGGKLFDKNSTTDMELTQITGGYNPSDVAFDNMYDYPYLKPTKAIDMPNKQLTFTSSDGYCSAFITGNRIDLGGFDTLNINQAGTYVTRIYASVVILDQDFNIIQSVTIAQDSSVRHISLNDTIKSGGKYYIAYESNNRSTTYIGDVYLS